MTGQCFTPDLSPLGAGSSFEIQELGGTQAHQLNPRPPPGKLQRRTSSSYNRKISSTLRAKKISRTSRACSARSRRRSGRRTAPSMSKARNRTRTTNLRPWLGLRRRGLFGRGSSSFTGRRDAPARRSSTAELSTSRQSRPRRNSFTSVRSY